MGEGSRRFRVITAALGLLVLSACNNQSDPNAGGNDDVSVIPKDLPIQPANVDAVTVALTIDESGKVAALVDKATSETRVTPLSAFQPHLCVVTVAGVDHKPTKFQTDGTHLVFTFESLSPAPIVELSVQVVLRHVVVRVEHVENGGQIEALRFVNLSTQNAFDALNFRFVAYHDPAGDRYLAICPLDIFTETAIGPSGFLFATAVPNLTYPESIGFEGRSVALFTCGTDPASVFDLVAEVESAHGLPAGVAAKQRPELRHSCFFWMELPPANSADALQLTLDAGMGRILMLFETYTDVLQRWSLAPQWGSVEALRAFIDQCRAAGIKVGAHTPVGDCPKKSLIYVGPGADPRLLRDRRVTLAAGISAGLSDGLIETREPVSDWPLGLGQRDIVIDGEIIEFSGLKTNGPPFGLLGPFVRAKNQSGDGQLGPHAHTAGTPVEHLAEKSGEFAYRWDPGPTGGIYQGADDVAAIYNAVGFDNLYCDELEPFPPGGYGADVLISTLYDRLDPSNKPRFIEASNDSGWLTWHYLGIEGQMDYTFIETSGFKSEVDRNVQVHDNLRSLAYLTPLQFGWAEIANPGSPYSASPDDLEYLCARSLAYDRPMVLQVWYSTLISWPNLSANLNLLNRYEVVRLAGSIPESDRAAARSTGKDCMLFNVSETEVFRPVTQLSLPLAPGLRGFITDDPINGARFATIWAVDGQAAALVLPGVTASQIEVRDHLAQEILPLDTVAGARISLPGRIYIRLTSILSAETTLAAALVTAP